MVHLRPALDNPAGEDWLYYLPDAEGLVRQGADAAGDVTGAWLFDPSGVVLEGPQGPVSHLVCGGVYDWSTGLIYKGGRYFDPLLGIWLALLPLVVVQSWRGRKKGRRGSWAVALALFLVGASGILTGCGCNETEPPPTACTELKEQVVEKAADGYLVFVNNASAYDNLPSAGDWPQDKIDQVMEIYEDAIYDDRGTHSGYSGARGFGSLEQWASAFGICQAPSECPGPDCVHAGGAIRLIYTTGTSAHGGRYISTACGSVPGIKFGDGSNPVADLEQAYHEMAHIWHQNQGDTPVTDLQTRMGVESYRGYSGSPADASTDIDNHGNFPTEYATASPWEDFADSVTAYFLGTNQNMSVPYYDWSDDDPWYQSVEGVAADERWSMDRYDYVEELFSRTW